MKKATTTRSGLEEQLLRVVEVLQATAGLDIEAHAAGWMVEPSTMNRKFFAIGEPLPASDRGRGQRFNIPVSWIWGPAQMDEQQAAEVIAESIRAIPGVEEVTVPVRDAQLGLAWTADVTIRFSQ